MMTLEKNQTENFNLVEVEQTIAKFQEELQQLQAYRMDAITNDIKLKLTDEEYKSKMKGINAYLASTFQDANTLSTSLETTPAAATYENRMKKVKEKMIKLKFP